MQKDSPLGTVIIATILCVVCSFVVSLSAVGLKERQELNAALDIKKNILLASGLLENPKATKEEVLDAFSQIKAEVVELSSGEVLSDIDVDAFDQSEERSNPETSITIDPDKDLGGIKRRAKRAKIFKVLGETGQVEKIILPVHGNGLWSTLYGFLAISSDAQLIEGLGFYSHGETAGLGGEVDNPDWKAQFVGKKIWDAQANPAIRVVKGKVNPSSSEKDYQVDGLSGATITSNGVTYLLQYWLGDDGFGPYLKRLKKSQGMG